MSLDAGSVYTTLGGRFNPGGFEAFDAANKKAAASAEAAEGRITASSGRIAKAHESITSSAQKMASSAARISEAVPLKAMDQWGKSSEQAGRNLSALGNVAAKTAAVGVLALGAATIYAATKATTFNREMLKISTQAGGTTAEVKKLSAEVLKMAGTVPQGPQKLAEGLYHIESAGFRGSQALDMLKASAEGAALGNASLENTTQAMIAAMASQIKGVSGSSDAMGQLNAIVGIGDMKMEQLAQAMATGLLPSAANAGLALKDVGAALATVTDNATPANVTATRLRMTIALMASPSKAAAKQLESIGMSSTQMAHDMRQPNGLLKAVEDLKTHLKDSGLTAEQQFGVLSKVFGGGRSSAVIQTLIAETDRLKTKYQELGAANGVEKLSKSWSEYQKSEAAGFGELKSGVEAFAITISNVLMPELTKLSREGAHALAGFVSGGGAAQVGAGITATFSAIGDALSNLAGTVEPVALGLFHIAAAATSVGQSLGLGLGGQVATLAAGFLAFKAATFVAPILMAVAAGISTIGVAAATAPTLGAFAGDLIALAGGPVGAIAIGLGIAAAAFTAFNSGLFSSTSAAEQNAAALRADKQAVEDLHNATLKASEADVAAKRAALEHKKAVEDRKKVEGETRGPHPRLKGAAAENAVADAQLREAETANRSTAAMREATQALEKHTQSKQKALTTAQAGQHAALEELETVKKTAELHAAQSGTQQERALWQTKINEAQEAYNRSAEKTSQINTEIAVSQESLNRLNAGQSAITSANAQGVQQLQSALSAAHAPQKIVTRYELDDQGAQAKLGELASALSQLGRQKIVAQILTTAPTASAAILAMRAVLAGVPSSKVIQILHNAKSSGQAMHELTGAINSVPASKGITINTNAAEARLRIEEVQASVEALPGIKNVAIAVTKTTTAVENVVRNAIGLPHKAAGGPPTAGGQTALVGEGGAPEYVIDAATGRGVKVNGPTLMGLSSSDYVVPLEDRFRGRALGLFAMLAGDLGIPGYAAGRAAKPHGAGGGKGSVHIGGKGIGKAHHEARALPEHIDALSLPVEEIQTALEKAKTGHDKSHERAHSLGEQITANERSSRYATGKNAGKTRAKNAERLSELKAKRQQALAEERRQGDELKDAQKALRDAKAYQARISKATDLVNVAGNDMRLADGRDDQGGYESAKARRLKALGDLKKLVGDAERHVAVDTSYFRQLYQQVQGAELDAQATSAEAFAPPSDPAAEREASSGMTDAEAAKLLQLEADQALAALTPGLGDDTAAAQALTTFLEGVLGEAQAEPAARGGEATIKSLAGAVKGARENLASLTGGGGSNSNADLQAQIKQQTERAEAATRQAQTAENALQVFGGSGDIGSGGGNARGAVTQNIYTLHPGDPATLSAIGNAAVSGIGLQTSRRAVRERVGP